MSGLMLCQKLHTKLVVMGLDDVAGGGADDVAIGVGLLTFEI